LKNEIQDLKLEIGALKETVRASNVAVALAIPRPSVRIPSDKKSCLDEDEYLTADDEEEAEAVALEERYKSHAILLLPFSFLPP